MRVPTTEEIGIQMKNNPVRIDVFEEHIAFIISMERISELGTTLAVTSNRSTLRTLRLLVTANIIHSSPILVTLMIQGGTFLRDVGSYKSPAA
jgi:hypothetical protein